MASHYFNNQYWCYWLTMIVWHWPRYFASIFNKAPRGEWSIHLNKGRLCWKQLNNSGCQLWHDPWEENEQCSACTLREIHLKPQLTISSYGSMIAIHRTIITELKNVPLLSYLRLIVYFKKKSMLIVFLYSLANIRSECTYVAALRPYTWFD